MLLQKTALLTCALSRLLVSHRGVVFFRKQTNLTQALLNKLATKISHASGKPTASKLHIHPLSKEFSESGQFIGGEKIDSEKDSEGRQISFKSEKSNFASAGWHTDISFEPVPSDYAMLQLRTLPRTGGDTMWSSMYSAYDALSPHMRVFLEGLTATHDAEEFREQSAKYVELIECASASFDRSFLQIWIPAIHKGARTP